MEVYGHDSGEGLASIGITAIYVTHLSKLKKRRLALERFLDKEGLRAIFITGWDADQFEEDDVACLYPTANPFQMHATREHFPSSWLSVSELSIATKHFAAFHDMVTHGHKHALVLEDDALPAPAFAKRLRKLVAGWPAREQYHVLFLGSYSQLYSEGETWAVRRPDLSPEISPVGYLVSRAGARHFLDNMPILGPLDMLLANTKARYPGPKNGTLLFPTATWESFEVHPTPLIAHGSLWWSKLPEYTHLANESSTSRSGISRGPWASPPDLNQCVGALCRRCTPHVGGGRCPPPPTVCSLSPNVLSIDGARRAAYLERMIINTSNRFSGFGVQPSQLPSCAYPISHA